MNEEEIPKERTVAIQTQCPSCEFKFFLPTEHLEQFLKAAQESVDAKRK